MTVFQENDDCVAMILYEKVGKNRQLKSGQFLKTFLGSINVGIIKFCLFKVGLEIEIFRNIVQFQDVKSPRRQFSLILHQTS